MAGSARPAGRVDDHLIPSNESERLEAVRRYDVLDTPPDGAFDRITNLAARLAGVPIAIVSIVDEDRIWFKSHHGLDVDEIGRDPGLCASAILQNDPWVVTDASVDPRTLANPLVASSFGLRFYAGVPLRTRDGFNLGTLCVIDQKPREVTEEDLATLSDLAAVVVDELELRLSARERLALEADMRSRAEQMARTLQEGLLPVGLPQDSGFELAARYHAADVNQVGGDVYDVMPVDDGIAFFVGDVCGKGPPAAAMTASARWALRAVMSSSWAPASGLTHLNEVLVSADAHSGRYLTMAVGTLKRLPDAAELTVALGGHPPALVVRADGTVESLGTSRPIVGWAPGVSYVDSTTRLHASDAVVLYTDGLWEALGRLPEAEVRLADLLRAQAGRSAEEIADALDASLRSATRDDTAFLIVRVP